MSDDFTQNMIDNLIRRVRINLNVGVPEGTIVELLQKEYSVGDIYLAINVANILNKETNGKYSE